MKERLVRKRALEHHGDEDYYQGRRIIHRDSEIDGGVYLGQGEREAIVVDSEKYSEIRKLYERAKERATVDGVFRKDRVLQSVFDVVKEAMPRQSAVGVQSILRRYKIGPDEKIALDVFLREGVGVCRHSALACGVVLELFKKEGLVQGAPSVDRNANAFGGHAWCRYVNSVGEKFVLDVTRNYIGLLKDAFGKRRWAYKRPDDF